MSADLTVDDKLKAELSHLYDPTTGLWAGKYKSAAELVKGTTEAGNALAASRKEADELRKQKSEYEAFILQGGVKRGDPSSGYSGELSPLKELQELGLPTEGLMSAIEKKAEEKANKVFEQKFGPFFGTAQARDLMVQRNPDYMKQEPEVLAYIGQSPELKEDYEQAAQTGNPKLVAMALDNARLRWIEAGGGERKSVADDDRTKAAKAAASLGGGGSATERSAVPTGESREKELEQMRSNFRQTKDERAFVRDYFKGQPQTWNDWLNAQAAEKQG